MVKSSVIYIFCVLATFNVYAQKEKKAIFSYVTINVGTFLATQTKIESNETGKLLENFNSPGVSFGLTYTAEKSHFFMSGGLNARILPVGYQILIKNKDLTGNPANIGSDDLLIKSSEYFFQILSVPLKIGYQTLENKAKQKFWVNAGIEANFTSSQGLDAGYMRTETNPTTYPTFILGGGVSKVQKNGDQLRFGLEYNISNTTIVNGTYNVTLRNSSANGTFSDTGTYIGFNFAYAFKLKKT